MNETVYEELVKRQEAERYLPLPAGMNQPFLEWLKDQLTEEQAAFLLLLPPSEEDPLSLSDIAKRAGMSEEETQTTLKMLIDKAIVIDHEIEGLEARPYSLAHWIGWAENYLHRYVDLTSPKQRQIDVKLAHWLEKVKQSDDFRDDKAYTFRVLPVERAIQDARETVPMARVAEIIEGAGYISVMRCLCRTSGHLVGEPCEYPLEVCFSLEDYARYQVENGFARKVTKEWALKTIKECEELGLLHSIDNIKGVHRVLCNCCPCHCIPVTGFAKARPLQRSARSDYINSVDLDACEGVGLCVEKCGYGALEMDNGKVSVKEERCIGCGVCTTICPNDALSLKARPAEMRDKYYETHEEFKEALFR